MHADDMILYMEKSKHSTKKTVRTDKAIQQSHKVQNQQTENSSFLIHQ